MANVKIAAELTLLNGQYLAKLKESQKKTQEFNTNVQGMFTALKGFAGFQIAKEIAEVFAGIAEHAGKIDSIKSSFTAMTKSFGTDGQKLVDAMKTASLGTLSEMQIMESANLAMSLMGEKVIENLPKMMEVARAAAKTTGKDVNQMFSDLIVAAGRQSVQILDNLGISSATAARYQEEYAAKLGKTREQLNATEKANAFFYATMKAGGELMARVDMSTLSLGEKLQVFRARMDDAKDGFAQGLSPALSDFLGIILQGESGITRLSTCIGQLVGVFLRLTDVIPSPFGALADLGHAMNMASKESTNLMNLLTGIGKNYAKLSNERMKNQKEQMDKIGYDLTHLGKLKDDEVKKDKLRFANKVADEKKAQDDAFKSFMDKIRTYGQDRIMAAKINQDAELKELDKFHAAGLLKEEDYQTARSKILKKHSDEALREFRKLTEEQENAFTRSTNIYQENITKLQEAVDAGLITQQQYFEMSDNNSMQYLGNLASATTGTFNTILSGASNMIGQIDRLNQMSTERRIAQYQLMYKWAVWWVTNNIKDENQRDSILQQLSDIQQVREYMAKRKAARDSRELQYYQAYVAAFSGAVSAAASVAIIPYVGPFLAIAAFAAFLAMGIANAEMIHAAPLPMFDKGAMSIPYDMPAIVHKNETILPAGFAEEFRDVISGGGGGERVIQLVVDGRVLSEVVDNERGWKASSMGARNYSRRSVYA